MAMKQAENNKKPQRVTLVENVHFYIENGNYVFTKKYLEERGYCCENGCRHCPYGFQKGHRKDVTN